MSGLILLVAAVITTIALTELLMPEKHYDETDRIAERQRMREQRHSDTQSRTTPTDPKDLLR